jgi:predicted XRE-type DNA-binding protein
MLRRMEIERGGNAWESLTDTLEDAAHLALRSQLLLVVGDAIIGWNLTPAESASRLGITPSRLDDLLRGRIGKFSLDALIALSARCGLTVDVDIRGADKAAP